MKLFKLNKSAFYVHIFMAMFLCTVVSCKKSEANATNEVLIPSDTTQILKTYLALGDSYTIGTSVTAEQRFPNQAAVLLAQQGVQFKLPDIIATNGWTTGNLLASLASNPPVTRYDIVTLLIGVNNQYQGRTQAEYKSQFTDLLFKAIAYAGGKKSRVIVLSIPDYSLTPFAQNSDTARIAREINEFNAINQQVSSENGVTYLNITGISREAGLDPTLIAADGLHPSGKQYARWVALLAPLIKSAL